MSIEDPRKERLPLGMQIRPIMRLYDIISDLRCRAAYETIAIYTKRLQNSRSHTLYFGSRAGAMYNEGERRELSTRVIKILLNHYCQSIVQTLLMFQYHMIPKPWTRILATSSFEFRLSLAYKINVHLRISLAGTNPSVLIVRCFMASHLTEPSTMAQCHY